MKTRLPLLTLFLLPALAFCESVVITARVLDRAPDGSAILGQYVYPSVELESGETGNLHIGQELRYPTWIETEATDDGVREEVVYATKPIGFQLAIKVVAADGVITYGGETVSTVVEGMSASGVGLTSSEGMFVGRVADGERVDVEIPGPDGTPEQIALHFAVKGD